MDKQPNQSGEDRIQQKVPVVSGFQNLVYLAPQQFYLASPNNGHLQQAGQQQLAMQSSNSNSNLVPVVPRTRSLTFHQSMNPYNSLTQPRNGTNGGQPVLQPFDATSSSAFQ